MPGGKGVILGGKFHIDFLPILWGDEVSESKLEFKLSDPILDYCPEETLNTNYFFKLGNQVTNVKS